MLEWCKNCKNNYVRHKEKTLPCRDCKKRFGLWSRWEPMKADPPNDATKPRAIYISFSPHDCEALYDCPVCGRRFGSWDIFNQKKNENGTEKYCPECKTELDGLN